MSLLYGIVGWILLMGVIIVMGGIVIEIGKVLDKKIGMGIEGLGSFLLAVILFFIIPFFATKCVLFGLDDNFSEGFLIPGLMLFAPIAAGVLLFAIASLGKGMEHTTEQRKTVIRGMIWCGILLAFMIVINLGWSTIAEYQRVDTVRKETQEKREREAYEDLKKFNERQSEETNRFMRERGF
jgi:hypothetical protein